jgi:hypothetical protein
MEGTIVIFGDIFISINHQRAIGQKIKKCYFRKELIPLWNTEMLLE